MTESTGDDVRLMGQSTDYRRVLASARWRDMRKRRLLATRWHCEQCGKGEIERDLELHHKTYDRLGHERADDVILLCRRCHAPADDARKEATSARIWDARVDGWATKVYGENWEYRADWETVEEEFSHWLDTRDEWFA